MARITKTVEIDDALRRFQLTPDDARVRRPVVRVLFGGICDRTLDTRMAAGLIPRPVHDNPYEGWRVGDLRRALRGDAEGA